MILPFTLRQIRYFVAVAEFGSISRASERLNVSPPSLSTAIAQLETAFGIQLFIRQHAQGLSLTTEGRRFLHEAKQLMTHVSAMQCSANEMSQQLRGPLSVGCHIAFSAIVLPTIRRCFEDSHSNILWSTTTGDQAFLLEKLGAGEIDVALTYDLEMPKDLAFEPLARLAPHAIFAADHPFSARPSLSLEDLAPLPLVLLDLPFSREYFLELFDAVGLLPTIFERVSDNNLLRSMVANRLGYSLANIRPLNSAAADGKPIRMIPLTGSHRALQVGVVSARDNFRPKVLLSFYALCRRLIRDDVIPGMAPPLAEAGVAAPDKPSGEEEAA